MTDLIEVQSEVRLVLVLAALVPRDRPSLHRLPYQSQLLAGCPSPAIY